MFSSRIGRQQWVKQGPGRGRGHGLELLTTLLKKGSDRG
jgi:hypothetical protein